MFQFPLDNLSVTTRFIVYNPFSTTPTMHYGMDYGCASGTPVYAANDGKIVLSGWDSAGGNMIAIQGIQELSRYAHLNKRLVSVGDSVHRGQLIAYSGNTGSATTGAHLHFETWVTPKGYSYKYSDRTKYAVDPMSVCHLLEGQTFDNNGLATMKPIPYPEPKFSVELVGGKLSVSNGSVRMRLMPEVTEYQYLVGGYNRANDVLSKFDNRTSFDVVAKCVNGGYTWGLAETAVGQYWIAELSGKTKFSFSEDNTPVVGNSPLVSYTLISPNKNSPRNNSIKKITIHHMAGNLSVERCGEVFQTRQASSNYGIGTDGRIGMYVEEKDRSWCSSSPQNDHQAITIEVANDGGEPDWHVSDLALARCIELCVDICKRNNLPGLTWTGDKNGTLTIHKMFTATACPGPYLESKMPWIAETVTKWVSNTDEPVRLKIGFASAGDVKNISYLLDLEGVAYSAADGYITTATVSGLSRVVVEVYAELLGIPTEVVEDEPDADLKKKNEELKAEVAELKSKMDEIKVLATY